MVTEQKKCPTRDGATAITIGPRLTRKIQKTQMESQPSPNWRKVRQKRAMALEFGRPPGEMLYQIFTYEYSIWNLNRR